MPAAPSAAPTGVLITNIGTPAAPTAKAQPAHLDALTTLILPAL